jgi:hypothetical protein
LETTQYRARPAGNPRVKNPNITGIIHCIIVFMDACLGSWGALVIIILCCTHMDTPTSTGIRNLVGSGSARSIHRKPLFRGTASCTAGIQAHNRWDRST